MLEPPSSQENPLYGRHLNSGLPSKTVGRDLEKCCKYDTSSTFSILEPSMLRESFLIGGCNLENKYLTVFPLSRVSTDELCLLPSLPSASMVQCERKESHVTLYLGECHKLDTLHMHSVPSFTLRSADPNISLHMAF